jgi:rare lipoprotein A
MLLIRDLRVCQLVIAPRKGCASVRISSPQAVPTSQKSHAPRLALALVAAALVSQACSTARWPGAEGLGAGRPQVGLASFYDERHRGRRTASGELYDERALTAAHRSLPFGTRLEVTNLENDRSVVVRVNDRGPFVKNRVVDLSLAAARALGITEQGTTRVRIRALR